MSRWSVSEDFAQLTIAVRSDRVTVAAAPGAPLTVRGGRLITEDGGRLRVDATQGPVEVSCPEGTSVTIGTTSGHVKCRGNLGVVHITTSSGRIDVERATKVDIRTKSGRVEVGSCDEDCTVRTKSSTVEIGRAGKVDVSTKSGRVTANAVKGAMVHTVSGSVRLTALGTPNVSARSHSGAMDVKLPTGSTPAMNLTTLSGHVSQQCSPGTDGQVDVETASGAITVSCQ